MQSVMQEKKIIITDTPEDELILFPLELNSACVMNSDNQLTLNHSTNLIVRTLLIRWKGHLTKRLKMPPMIQTHWKLRIATVHHLPKHLNLWLSKNLLNFSGTAYLLHRQKLCHSDICRRCLTETELETLHMLDCK